MILKDDAISIEEGDEVPTSENQSIDMFAEDKSKYLKF
jgi:hypothetical protein